jgi:hypothetical protein
VNGSFASIHGARRGAGFRLGADHETLIRILQAVDHELGDMLPADQHGRLGLAAVADGQLLDGAVPIIHEGSMRVR